ncbi:uncharacterized protein PHALS_11821 [Plasmopara halstedii]|uniref:Uncharacterized protein n=1 Tax=Plasmopara halstedii TaxID=4781 RepID=A0A0P1AKM0_PLAHL|nr:uncharacterized protein PHALS_11821 [Plasmopara halstedii]CEG41479.1 hypothetical protein PHALS_11821 [Plasmopara halstedii]|eukprot:XP_024577848.1 hypothetical protein PHALS_11821 [Plasmopara halstedii]
MSRTPVGNLTWVKCIDEYVKRYPEEEFCPIQLVRHYVMDEKLAKLVLTVTPEYEKDANQFQNMLMLDWSAAVLTRVDSSPNSVTLDLSPVIVSPDVALGSVLDSIVPSPSDKPYKTHRVIPGTVPAHAHEWKMTRHSWYGVLNRNGAKFIKPGTPVPCDLAIDSHDLSALRYSSLVCEDLHGFTTDTSLVPMSSICSLKQAHLMPLTVEQVTPAELDNITAEFIAPDVLNFTSHEDVLANILAKSAYFRQLFKISLQRQQQIVTDHAIYRNIWALPVSSGQPADSLSRLRSRFGDKLPNSDALLEAIIPDE